MAERINIDPDKLRAELTMRNLKLRTACEAMGYSKQALNDVLKRGHIGKPMATMLDKLFNIKIDDYKLHPETRTEEKTEPEPNVAFDLDYFFKRLEKVVYASTYNAVKQAWGEM